MTKDKERRKREEKGKNPLFSKKVKKRVKKVLTKRSRRGIIIELSESGTPERSDRHPNGEPVRKFREAEPKRFKKILKKELDKLKTTCYNK